MENCSIISTPVGNLKITVSSGNVTGIAYTEENVLAGDDPLLKETERQLEEYFAGRRKTFDLPLDLQGTAFQKKVWQIGRAHV